MSDHLDRAAEAMWGATTSDGLRAAIRPDCWEMAKALDAAGLLVTPARDEAIRADERAKVLAELEGADCAHDWGSPFEMPEIGWSKVRECADCGAVERIEREAGVLNADA